MITDEQVRSIALFFLLSFMDEKTSLQASHRTVSYLKTKSPDKAGAVPVPRVTLVRALGKNFEHQRKQFPRSRPATAPESAWTLVDPSDLDAWSRFQKDSSDGEIVAVIFSKVLVFTDHEIAEGLNISLGTARYRIGKGMRQLGIARRAKG